MIKFILGLLFYFLIRGWSWDMFILLMLLGFSGISYLMNHLNQKEEDNVYA